MPLFYDDLPAAWDSEAYGSYLETIYGGRILLDDSLIEEDVKALTAFAARARGGRILDAGCGTGDLLRRLCAENDADGIGIDLSPSCLRGAAGDAALPPPPGEGEPRGLLARVEAIEAAREATKAVKGLYGRLMARERMESGEYREGRVRFLRTSIEEARGVEGPFDLIVAIDSIEECPDPRKALDRLIPLLSPSGALMIAHTERLAEGELIESSLDFSLTRVAAALKGRGLKIRGRDISRSEKLHWRLSDRLLDSLKEACEAEGNIALYDRVRERTERMRSVLESGGFKRYWYCVEKGGR